MILWLVFGSRPNKQPTLQARARLRPWRKKASGILAVPTATGAGVETRFCGLEIGHRPVATRPQNTPVGVGDAVVSTRAARGHAQRGGSAGECCRGVPAVTPRRGIPTVTPAAATRRGGGAFHGAFPLSRPTRRLSGGALPGRSRCHARRGGSAGRPSTGRSRCHARVKLRKW
jgi:hypothetical protein